jgi:hypothetical protein
LRYEKEIARRLVNRILSKEEIFKRKKTHSISSRLDMCIYLYETFFKLLGIKYT